VIEYNGYLPLLTVKLICFTPQNESPSLKCILSQPEAKGRVLFRALDIVPC